jgi:hypothetical protein
MVDRYNISLNYKLESLQNDPCVQKKDYRVAQKSKLTCVFHTHNQREAGLVFIFWLLLVLLIGF